MKCTVEEAKKGRFIVCTFSSLEFYASDGKIIPSLMTASIPVI
jgi:hypothetical protein